MFSCDTGTDSYSLAKTHTSTFISSLRASPRLWLEASGRKPEGPWQRLSCLGYGLCFCSWCIVCSNFYCLTKHPLVVFGGFTFITQSLQLKCKRAFDSWSCLFTLAVYKLQYNHAESIFLVITFQGTVKMMKKL